ncbi:TonB-dependent receptor [Caulobacter segnis]|uniref:TonB-dependent receptor n=1 Tax=Caulobacter segnis TaxID=88688 RepID=UPI00240F14D3|nr:TonB-dependent receptor [Caulobacter segnis]MDG2523620.1 TonB-dependent receptor [Caulobacter segnis]
MHFTRFIRRSASVLVLASAAASAAHAQDAIATIDSIIVTAQKREQNLQDVPIVVTALPQQLLQDAGVRDIKDLQILTPGLNVASTSNETNTTVRIRGVGTVGDNPGLESSVLVTIDGVYRPRNGVAFNDLGELERIEVLKGPQGTLFGKNTSAGVINIITKAPEFVFGAEAEATFGNYGTKGGSVAVTGPIMGDKLAGRLFAAVRERDGFYDIVTGQGPRTNTEDGNQDYYTVRGQLLFTPNDDVDVRIIADYTKRDESCCVGVQIVNGATAPIVNALGGGNALANPPRPFDRTSYANRPTDQEIEDMGASMEVNWDLEGLGGATITSITAGRNWKTNNGQDIDFTTMDLAYRTPDWSTEFGQFSQELRLAGRTERLDWQVGLFYARETLDQYTPFVFGRQYETYLSLLLSSGTNPNLVSLLTGLPSGSIFTPGAGARDTYKQKSNSLAFFTNNTLKLTDAFDITLGLRYTREEKDLSTRYTNAPGTNGCAAALSRVPIIAGAVGAANAATVLGNICLPWTDPGFNNRGTQQAREEDELTGTIKASYRWNEDVMTYASYARGYKAGGFNLDRARIGLGVVNPDTAFPEETVDSYELGLKTSWLNRTLSLNAAAFHQEFQGFQLNAFTGTSYIVTSIPKVKSVGVDTDLLWFTPLKGLTLQGGVTYAVTEYGQFTPGAGVSPRLPGARLSFAPLWSGSMAASYSHDLGDTLELRTSLSGKYSSMFNTGSDLHPAKEQDAFWLVNARIAIGTQDERWTAELWAQNLLDEEYLQVGYDAPLQSGGFDAFLGAPRTYGVTLRAKF